MRRLSLLFAVILIGLLVLPSLVVAAGPVYTTYNMWYEKPSRIWAVNYKRGALLPAGTRVKDVQVFKEDYYPHQYISFKRASDNQAFRVYFRRKFHPGKTIEDYRKLMFCNKTFREQTEGMTQREINAISRGVLVAGMGKKAVQMSYGVPPQHQTPNLNANLWRYWTSRMVRKNVCFDRDGRTVKCLPDEML